MRRTAIIVVALLLVLCCLAAAAGGLAYFYYVPAVEAGPVVFISSPAHAQQAEVGEIISVQALARDEKKVTRVELWVDGVLQTSQESSLPGGISPFPMLATWQPLSSGTHILIVRAFNAQNAHAHTSVTVDALELPDADGDGVADEDDSCPDEPALGTSAGCPDGDGDGIPDAGDACPDQVGVPEEEGCPSVTEADRDGDGVADADDACPDELGLPQHDGCPRPADLDGDDVVDELDACPGEPGLSELNGCPDLDGDGISDGDDDCPAQPGMPGQGGCPDTDGDGVRDPDDLRPDDPGRPEDYGAPDTGAPDSDGDGLADDLDLCDDEEGLPEHDGCALPGSGEEEPPGGGLDLLGVVEVFLPPPLPAAMTLVEFEALEFEVFDDYNDVYCYAALAGEGMERYGPFNPLGERRWDIAEYLGGENSRHLAVPMGEPLEVQVECFAYVTAEGPGWTAEAIYDLGSFERSHDRLEWTGEDIVVQSDPGPDGHFFQVKYRLCAGACETPAVPAPYIHTMYDWMGQRRIAWSWDGDDAAISGFNLYVNGNLWTSVGHFRSFTFYNLEPSCGERLELWMTAFSGVPLTPDRESPRSNTIVLEGPPCPRTVRVTFLDIHTYDLPADPPGMHDDTCWDTQVGPIDMGTGAAADGLRLWTTYGVSCRTGHNCRRIGGYCLHPNTRHSIMDMIEDCRFFRNELSNDRDPYGPLCPNNNFLEATLGPHDDLVVSANIQDMDTNGSLEYLMRGSVTVGSDELVPGSEYERTISDSEGRGFADVTVRLEVLPVGP
ncbi:MAG: Ig-like domain-containing protein [Anaerolineae bacterium]